MPNNKYLGESENAKLRRICDFFGRRAIAFALGLDDSGGVTAQIDNTDFSVGQKKVVLDIESRLATIQRAIVSSPESFGRADDDIHAEAQFQLHYPHVFFNYRKQVGGSCLHTNPEDPLTSEICRIALYVYPSLLIQLHRKKADDSNFLSLGVSHYASDESSDYYKAFTKDKDFKDILDSPEDNQPVEFTQSVRLYSSSGGQNTFQICSFPTRIIQNAFVICCMRGNLSSIQIQLVIEELVASNRKAMRGQKAETPVFFGINGIGFENRNELVIGNDTVYSHSKHCFDLLPKGVKPALYNNEISGLIVEMSGPLSVTAASRDEGVVAQIPEILGVADYKNWYRDAETKLTNLCTAIMLSVDDYRSAIPKRSWSYVAPAFFDAPILSRLESHSAQGLSFCMKLLGDSEKKSIAEWTARLGPLEYRTRTALRRIQTGLTERVNPADGFIDAIIACDGVFGRGQNTELSFRISLTMACLLEPPGESRLNLKNEINKYYNERSGIVHGSKGTDKLSHDELKNKHARVVRLFLSCLRVLLTEYPHLLGTDDMSNRITCGCLHESF